MIFPRALTTLTLCISAFAATTPIPSMVLTAREYTEGGEHRPTPSYRPSVHRRRAQALNSLAPAEIAAEICPEDLYGCPIAEPGSLSSLPKTLSDWISGGYECIDPQADLRACGGCASLDAKHDCMLIPGANDISCVAGTCVVDSCLDSYKLDSKNKTCVPK